jgi:hypothetical protein
VFLCCNKKRNLFLQFHNENYFATTGVSDEAIYSSTDDGSGEDEDPWIPRLLSLPSEERRLSLSAILLTNRVERPSRGSSRWST